MTTRDENGAHACDVAPQGMTYDQRQPNLIPVAEASQQRTLNPNSKRASVLRVFLERGTVGLNCFEAVRLSNDYVLRSTVSELIRHYGIEFQKRFEQVPGHAGSKVDCVRYSLSPNGVARARELLGDLLREAA